MHVWYVHWVSPSLPLHSHILPFVHMCMRRPGFLLPYPSSPHTQIPHLLFAVPEIDEDSKAEDRDEVIAEDMEAQVFFAVFSLSLVSVIDLSLSFQF